MKLIIGLFALLLIIAIGGKFALDYYKGGSSFSLPFTSSSKKVTINNQTFEATVAESQKEKEIGLSEKKSLDQDAGMLFEFEKPDLYVFWMKNMKMSIDIIFIKDNTVVTVFSNVQPPKSENENLTLYQPDEPANKVLEISAGLASKYNIKKGDKVTIE